jgi:glycosyltransferase involved in cell wall biosynthesis
MKILYDHQIFELQLFGGISRYFYELLRCYATDPELATSLSFRFTNNLFLAQAPFLPLNPCLPRRSFKGKGFINSFFIRRCNKRDNRERIARQDYDIIHPTYYDPAFLEWCGARPVVVTIHDLIYDLFPEYYAPAERAMAAGMRLIAQRAEQVIAVSQATKADLLRLYGIAEEKVSVIPQACSLPEVAAAAGGGERFLLFVGERRRYKNFPRFVRAVAPLLHADPALRVVCTGILGFDEAEQRLFDECGVPGRFTHRRCTERQLAGLYAGATAFVFPSLYEGFGIPVLEAFRCGCPVIASNRASLPEVGGEAARYFDPESEVEMRGAIAEVLSSEPLRREMARMGRERVREFSWERTAALTKAVYLRVGQGKG